MRYDVLPFNFISLQNIKRLALIQLAISNILQRENTTLTTTTTTKIRIGKLSNLSHL